MNHRVQWCPTALPLTDCTTVAGGSGAGRESWQLDNVIAVAIDAAGNLVVSDHMNHRVQHCLTASNSECTTVVGVNGMGSGPSELHYPHGVTIDDNGKYAIVDSGNHRVQLCEAVPGAACRTVAGGNGMGAGLEQLHYPAGIAIGAYGGYVIADSFNHRIQLCPATGFGSVCTTVAGGNGPGSGAAQLLFPRDVAIDNEGLYVIADSLNHRIQKCSGVTDCMTAVGGDGEGSGPTELWTPRGVAIDAIGNYIIADTLNHRIQSCAAIRGTSCATLAGGDGQGSGGWQLSYPQGVAIHPTLHLERLPTPPPTTYPPTAAPTRAPTTILELNRGFETGPIFGAVLGCALISVARSHP